LEEIEKQLEEEGFVCRISFDEMDEDDDVSLEDIETTDFAAEADPKKIEKWEAELPDDNDFECDPDDKPDDDEPDDDEPDTDGPNAHDLEDEKKITEKNEDWNRAQNEPGRKNTDDAEVVYFDLFKKKVYLKTLIFQREEEADREIYKLIGFCEAPMV